MPALLSILLPIYNAAATLDECLDSILKQTYPNFEVVIIDDGSTDSTLDILQQYQQQDQRCKVHSIQHSGIIVALNHGLQQCQGTYIARMDGDDRMLPQRLEKQLNFAGQHPDIDLIGAQIRLFRDDQELSPAQLRYQDWSNKLLDDAAIKQDFFVESAIAHPTFFAHQDIFTKLGGYRDNHWAEDYDFLLRARQYGMCFGKVPEVLVEKRDSSQRLYRSDSRYKRNAMLQAKAYYFVQGDWLNNKQLIIAGSGSTARTVAKMLLAQGVGIAGFIDNIDTRGKRTVMSLPAYHRNSTTVQQLLQQAEEYFFLLCIGNATGRAEQLDQLHCAGLQPQQHYLRFL